MNANHIAHQIAKHRRLCPLIPASFLNRSCIFCTAGTNLVPVWRRRAVR